MPDEQEEQVSVVHVADSEETTEAVMLRVQMAELIARFTSSKQDEFDILAHVDNALEACALAGGGRGIEIRQRWLAGVGAFLRPLD